MSPKAARIIWGSVDAVLAVTLAGVAAHAFYYSIDGIANTRAAVEAGQRAIYSIESKALGMLPGAEAPEKAASGETAPPAGVKEPEPSHAEAEAQAAPPPAAAAPEAPEAPKEAENSEPAAPPIAEPQAQAPASAPAPEETHATEAAPSVPAAAEEAQAPSPAATPTAPPEQAAPTAAPTATAPTAETPAAAPETAPAPPEQATAPFPAPRYPGKSDIEVASLSAPNLSAIAPRGNPRSTPPASDPAMTEDSPAGKIPSAKASKAPWKAYAKPFTPSDKPVIAIVLTGLGLNQKVTEAALNLPEEITLSFNPYAPAMAVWAEKARKAGHEVMIDLPLQPVDYPLNDPGPQGLLTALAATENAKRLQWVMARYPGAVGMLAPEKEQFTASLGASVPVVSDIRGRGLIFFSRNGALEKSLADKTGSKGAPLFTSDVAIDAKPSAEAIAANLNLLAETAKRQGYASGSAEAYPLTLVRIYDWVRTLESQGVALAPITAIAAKR